MAWQQSDLDNLNAAMALAAARVDYGDKRTDFRTLAEMVELKAMMEAQLGVTPQVPSRKYGSFFRN